MKLDWNDLAMAFLGAVFVIFGANLLSDALYHSDVPKTAGFAIEGAPMEIAASAPEEKVIEDASLLIADIDPVKGENVAKKCAACHNFNEGGANKVGPVLWDMVNRPIASVEGFGYSNALREYASDGKVWDYAELNGFLYKPRDHVKGTSMGFAGLKKTEDRAAMIAYMRSLSNNPAPLPEPAAAVTPASAEEGEVEPAAVNAADGEAVTEEVEAPSTPAEATIEPVAPAVISPEETPSTTGAQPAIAPTETDQGATSDN